MANKASNDKRSRNVYGTLTYNSTTPDVFEFKGTEDEEVFIYKTIRDLSTTFAYLVLTRENHESGAYHYHFLAAYSSAIRYSKLVDLRTTFSSWSGSKADRIVFPDKNYRNCIGYIYKYRDQYEPIVYGDCPLNLESIVKKYVAADELKTLQESNGIEVSDKVLLEIEITNFVKDFMADKGYFVNFHTRGLFGVDKDTFYQELESLRFREMYGDSGLRLVDRLISSRQYYCLPMWQPDMDIIEFADCFWSLDQGCKYSKDTMIDCTPVRKYDYDLVLPACPTVFLASLNRHSWDHEDFKLSYGNQFRSKRRRLRSMYIHGIPNSGKSTLILPYIDVFKNVIQDWVDDGGFSLAGIAPYEKVYSEEINPFDPRFNVNEIKKVLEGVAFRTKKKHADPVDVSPKTMIIVSNDNVPLLTTNHLQAVYDRLDIYSTNSRLADADIDMMDVISAESGLVAVWCTTRDDRVVAN